MTSLRHVIHRTLLTCLLCQGVAYAETHGAASGPLITMGYIEFPPVFFTNFSGEPEGLLIDLARQVIPKAGYRWRHRSLPAKRMAQEIADGKLDLWIGLSTLPEFEGTTLVGDPVVATIQLNAYWLGDKPPIKAKEDLNGKRIITMHGYSYGGWIQYIQDAAHQIVECRAYDHRQAVDMLRLGRCDYLLNYSGPMKDELARAPIAALQLQSISALEARFVVSRKSKYADHLLNSLLMAYGQLVAEDQWPPH